MKKIRKEALILAVIAFLAGCALAVTGSLTGDEALRDGGIDLILILGGAIGGIIGASSSGGSGDS